MPFFELFKHDTQLVPVGAGDTLFLQGDDGDVMYVLVEGVAEIYIDNVLFESCDEGAIIGEIAVIDQAPRSATVIAVTPCKFALINKQRFHFLLDETPGFAIAVMKVMAQRLIKCDQRVIQSLK
jgi:CRP-like cAMP-binding protein